MELNIVSVGIALLIIGFALVMLGTGKAKVAVGGFIGPVPFGWANDPEMLKWIVFVTAIVAIIFVILMLRPL